MWEVKSVYVCVLWTFLHVRHHVLTFSFFVTPNKSCRHRLNTNLSCLWVAQTGPPSPSYYQSPSRPSLLLCTIWGVYGGGTMQTQWAPVRSLCQHAEPRSALITHDFQGLSDPLYFFFSKRKMPSQMYSLPISPQIFSCKVEAHAV